MSRADRQWQNYGNVQPVKITMPTPDDCSSIHVLQQLQLQQVELESQNNTLRQTVLELEQSYERFVDFYKFSPVGYFTLTSKGVIADVNLTGAEMLRLSRHELLGQYFSRYLTPDQADFWHLHLKKLLSQKNRLDCQLDLQCGDGSLGHFQLDSLLFEVPGQQPTARIVLTDVSERVRSEAALRQSEERWKFAIEGAGDGLWDWNIRTGEAFYSHRYQEMIGFAEGEIGNTADEWIKRIHPDDADGVMKAIQPYLDGKEGLATVEYRILCKDGRWQWTLGRGKVVSRDADGKPLRMIGTNSDITARKLAEESLKEAKLYAENQSQAKSRFLAAASHDLRQPAHALGMFVARLAALPHDTQTTHLVTCLEASVKALQDMLDGFFNLTHLNPKSMPMKIGSFPIQSIFEQLQNVFATAAIDKGLRLRFRPSNVWVQSDPNLLHRILLNLVNNAVRYTQQGSVLVACRPVRDGRHVRIQIWDSGTGIAPQHHRDIFNEFFQLENSERDRSKGLGVGLSIVERACQMLNYSLSLRSALGCGTRFSLTVPLAAPQLERKQNSSTEPPLMVDLTGLNVLLIEDDALGREGLEGLLVSWGCNVTVALGAKMACNLFRLDQPYQIIISDYRLGDGINGIDAVRMVRELAAQPIAACLISGDTDARLSEQAQAVGLILLQKPVRPAKLRSLLRHLAKSDVPQR